MPMLPELEKAFDEFAANWMAQKEREKVQIELKDLTGMSESEQAYARFSTQRLVLDEVFRELAIQDTARIDAFVLRMLETKIAEVKAHQPDLNDTDAYIVAGRLLKQLFACYHSALGQLLP